MCHVAGPVLAAIVLAGATGSIGLPTIALTVAFALGATAPLLIFALAGRRVAVRAFGRRARQIRITAGVVTILPAVALVFDLPAAQQWAIPDYTMSLERKVGDADEVRQQLNLHNPVNDPSVSATLANCTDGAPNSKTVVPHRISRGSPTG
jgi:hypothetical protein